MTKVRFVPICLYNCSELYWHIGNRPIHMFSMFYDKMNVELTQACFMTESEFYRTSDIVWLLPLILNTSFQIAQKNGQSRLHLFFKNTFFKLKLLELRRRIEHKKNRNKYVLYSSIMQKPMER